MQDLQLKLKESHQQRSKERREHQAQLSALESQIKAKLAAYKTQHKMFRAQGAPGAGPAALAPVVVMLSLALLPLCSSCRSRRLQGPF